MTASSYADPVDVQRRDGSPVAFCWRGRVYRVQGVLAHWLETGPWWQSASVRGLLTTGVPSHHPTASSAASTPARREGGGRDQDQREFWQVEAAAGRHGTPGVFELCADLTAATPTWSVTTVTEHPTPPNRDSS